MNKSLALMIALGVVPLGCDPGDAPAADDLREDDLDVDDDEQPADEAADTTNADESQTPRSSAGACVVTYYDIWSSKITAIAQGTGDCFELCKGWLRGTAKRYKYHRWGDLLSECHVHVDPKAYSTGVWSSSLDPTQYCPPTGATGGWEEGSLYISGFTLCGNTGSEPDVFQQITPSAYVSGKPW